MINVDQLKETTQEALKVADERLQFHFENTLLGCIEWNNQLNIVTISKRAEEIFGWTQQEFLDNKQNNDDHPHKENFAVARKVAEDLISGEVERNSLQHQNITKDGRKIWCEWFNSVLKDEDGKVITIISLVKDITISKEAEENSVKVNLLYAFISQINQNIVRVKNEKALYHNSCCIAIEFGKYKMAWIGLFNHKTKRIKLVDQCGIAEEDIHLFTDAPWLADGPQDSVLRTGTYFICNDIQNDVKLQDWKPFAAKHDIQSCIVLPITKSGDIIGSLNLYSELSNFSDKKHTKLLVEVAGDISFALDLFEQKKRHRATEKLVVEKEKQLEFETNNLNALINNTNDLMWSIDRNFKLITSNRPFNEMIKQMTGKPIPAGSNVLFTEFSDDQLNHYKKLYKRAFLGEAFTEIEYTSTPFEIWSEISFYPIRKKEKIIGTTCYSRNVSERMVAERKLRHSESRLKQAETIAQLGNWELSLINNSNSWSDEMYKILGTSKKNTKASLQSFFSFIHPDDLEYAQSKIAETYKTFQNSKFDFRILRKDGVIRHGYSEWRFELNKNDEPVRIFGIIQDVTDRKLAELERIKIGTDLVNRNIDLEQFAYIVSHNLRAPVANILGASDLLSVPGLLNTEKEELSLGLHESVTKLDEVIRDLNQILDVRSEIRESKECVHFSKLIEDIKLSINNLILGENIKIDYDFSATDELLTIKSYLYSIFYNLISNSIKYRRPSIPCIIKITSRLGKDMVEVNFKDNGIGIDLKKRGDQVFGLYKRFHTNIDGKGMGLFMVKTQVETLGGKIHVKSAVNKGSEFKIEFES